MLTTRRLFVAAAFAGLVAACAQPTPYTPVASSSDIGPVRLSAENIAIDVSGVSEAEAVSAALAAHRKALSVDQSGGRAISAVVNIENFTLIDRLFTSVSGIFSSMEGDVTFSDAATGEEIFVTERIRVDMRSVPMLESGIQTQDRETVQTDKMSKLFMQRARQALVASDT